MSTIKHKKMTINKNICLHYPPLLKTFGIKTITSRGDNVPCTHKTLTTILANTKNKAQNPNNTNTPLTPAAISSKKKKSTQTSLNSKACQSSPTTARRHCNAENTRKSSSNPIFYVFTTEFQKPRNDLDGNKQRFEFRTRRISHVTTVTSEI
jgi:hypothetical protein